MALSWVTVKCAGGCGCSLIVLTENKNQKHWCSSCPSTCGTKKSS